MARLSMPSSASVCSSRAAATRKTPEIAWPTGSSDAATASTVTVRAVSGVGSRWRRTFKVLVRGKSASGHHDAVAIRWCCARRPLARATIPVISAASPVPRSGTR